jgi:glutathione S-transferase
MSSLPARDLHERLLLRTSLTSPFGRKVRMAAVVLGLVDRFDIEHASTMDADDTLRSQMPLGKIPCLILPDGTAIYDSRTIIEYLCSVAGPNTLFPGAPRELAIERTKVVLADGIADAALLMVYEGRFRPAAHLSQQWLDHQRGKIMRALTRIEVQPPRLDPLTAAGISLACALGYLDWRQPVEWRGVFPGIAAWLADFNEQHPELAATDDTRDGE